MKKQILIVASVCLVVGLAAVPARAQTPTTELGNEVFGVRATVPFRFVVLGKTFAAGEYTLFAAPQMVKIEDANGILVAMVLANEIPGGSAGATGQIIFHCYSDYCFLSELLSPIQGSRQLLTSRSETIMAKEKQGKYLTVLGGGPQK
jgi:hypothetical protein